MFSNNEINMFITMILPVDDDIFVSNDIIVGSDDLILTTILHVF